MDNDYCGLHKNTIKPKEPINAHLNATAMSTTLDTWEMCK